MAASEGKHVFVSYVHEDSDAIDQLCAVLEAARIPYWRDRKSLGPGDAWRAKIRDAIRGGSLVFLACFSENSRAKDRSYMNEELTLAVEEYRRLAPGRTWLIPVRLDAGEVPEWDLGAGRTLNDLNYSDFFGPRLAAEATSLVTTIHGVMGERQLGSAAALEAVEQVTAANRVELLKRLTKEMLPDSTRRIELDDLVRQEVRRIVEAINGSGSREPTGQSNEQIIVRLATQAEELLELTKPFCASLQVAARYGAPDQLAPWADGLRSIIQAANRDANGSRHYGDLGHLPGVIALMTTGLAATASRQWANLKALAVDGSIRGSYDNKPMALLEASSPYKPFDMNGWTANILAISRTSGDSFEDTLKGITGNQLPKRRTPVADWLHAALRPIFSDQLADDYTYDAEFDRAEVVLGILSQDAVDTRYGANSETSRWNHSNWFGRSTWRAAHYHGNPVEDLTQELTVDGRLWPPLRADLFGGEESRARAALDAYKADFSRRADSSW